MKKITSKNLTNRLSKYGALSVAIAGVANANGQIVYTDIADVTLDGTNVSYALDLDNNGVQDYLLRVNPTSGTPFAFIIPVTGSYYNSNGVVGFSSGPYNYPSNLANGENIANTSPFMATSQRGDLNFNGCAYSGSQFCDGMDGFLGFSFDISSNTHYGWARVQVSSDATTMIIKDYAYNSVADAPINAGQTLSTDEFALNSVHIACKDKIVTISNIQGETNYRVLNLTGQEVLNGNTRLESQNIDGSNLASGVYIVEVTDAVSNAQNRKKIIIE
ncbi:Por secretion system C-terminal sorting domain-containing protein [Bizionia echini]|uniref:Por secretion system C-terminal sorting domain-containing protein n=1 Tax=Bizionia echini TaxID=649333 RepID=A0A1I4ZXQ8_9FLAO|nr:T9SS type A sorting domain-containing protein [Bizionia echini]SFN54933.1 Por secretion system C-terminal sorting domain-containing protein [Bizionia echini]